MPSPMPDSAETQRLLERVIAGEAGAAGPVEVGEAILQKPCAISDKSPPIRNIPFVPRQCFPCPCPAASTRLVSARRQPDEWGEFICSVRKHIAEICIPEGS